MNNNSAETSNGSCESAFAADSTADYWHFVTAPNNGSFSFVSITLNLNGTLTFFSGDQIITNGSQTDNVFVRVPDGSTLDSIVLEGSSAEITPPTGDVKFVLSHYCVGSGGTTTTTVAPTTTIAETTTTLAPTTTIEETTTTLAPTTTIEETTTTVESGGPTTTAVEETTTTVESGGPTTTAVEETTTTVESGGPTTTAASTTLAPAVVPTTQGVGQAGPTPTIGNELPRTGSDAQDAMIPIAIGLLLMGGSLVIAARRNSPIV